MNKHLLPPSMAPARHLVPPQAQVEARDSLSQRFQADNWWERIQAPLPHGVDELQAAEECLHLVEQHPARIGALLQAHPGVAHEVVQLLPALRHEPQIARQLAQALAEGGHDFACAPDFPDSVKAWFAQREGPLMPHFPGQAGIDPLQRQRDLAALKAPIADPAPLLHPAQPSASRQVPFLAALGEGRLGLVDLETVAQELSAVDWAAEKNHKPVRQAFEQALLKPPVDGVFRTLSALQQSDRVPPDFLRVLLKAAYANARKFDTAPMQNMLSEMARSDPARLAAVMGDVLCATGKKGNATALRTLGLLMKDDPAALARSLTRTLEQGHAFHRAAIREPAIRLAKQDPRLFATMLTRGLDKASHHPGALGELTTLMETLAREDPAKCLAVLTHAFEMASRKERGMLINMASTLATINARVDAAFMVSALTHAEGPGARRETLRAAIRQGDKDFIADWTSAVARLQSRPETELRGKDASDVLKHMKNAQSEKLLFWRRDSQAFRALRRDADALMHYRSAQDLLLEASRKSPDLMDDQSTELSGA